MGGYATKMKGMRALIRWSLRSCVVQRRSWTLEAWTTSGEFRSLAYMRPLAIWSMHWALSKPTLFNQKTKLEADEGSLHRHKVGFAKVAQLLKLPQEEESRSILQVVFDYTCKRLWI